MGKGGGSRPAPPRQPSPEEVARAQMKVQAEMEAKKKAGWASDASQFLADNQITDDWRADIQGRSDNAAQEQIGMLNQQLGNTFQNIRQQQASQGLGTSAGRFGMGTQAQGMGQSSKQGILDSSSQRVDAFGRDRQGFLDQAASSIRGGMSIESASTRYKNDLSNANAAFEKMLAGASSGDQRNQAYQDFEANRGAAAKRFSDSMSQMESDALMASAATFGQTRDDDRISQGQALYGGQGTNTGGGQSTPLG